MFVWFCSKGRERERERSSANPSHEAGKIASRTKVYWPSQAGRTNRDIRDEPGLETTATGGRLGAGFWFGGKLGGGGGACVKSKIDCGATLRTAGSSQQIQRYLPTRNLPWPVPGKFPPLRASRCDACPCWPPRPHPAVPDRRMPHRASTVVRSWGFGYCMPRPPPHGHQYPVLGGGRLGGRRSL